MANIPAGEYRFLPLEKVVFGEGAINKLPEEIASLGSQRVAIIASNSLMNSSSLIVQNHLTNPKHVLVGKTVA